MQQGRIVAILVFLLSLSCIISSKQVSAAASVAQLSALNFACDECKILVDMLSEAATYGLEDTATEIATYFCYAILKVEDKRVCAGVIAEFVQELFQVVDAGFKLESDLICWGFFQSCPEPPNIPTWNVTFPKPKPPYVPPVYPAKDSPAYQVIQISDLHVDHLYQVGSYVNCGEPVCCRAVSPYHGDNATAREWGEYSCDGSPRMLEAVLKQIATTPATIVLWTGDTPPHFLWTQTQQSVLNDTLRVTQQMKEILPSNWIIVPSIGNHESFPVNNFGPPFLQKWLYYPLADAWSNWLPSDAVASLRNYGYFAINLPSKLVGGKGLKVISLQTNYCNNMAFWLYLNDTDPGNQLHWLIDELQESEDAGQAVWISGHIPPSTGSCMAPWANRLMEIITRYEMTVVGQFYGHTHTDSFVVNFADDGVRPSTVQYICPSVTTDTNINPSWRLYDVDAKSHQVLDYSQWHFNLSATYAKGGDPVPQLYYRARETYNMSTVFASSWANLVKRFSVDDAMFQKYNQHIFTGYPVGPCTGNCKASAICDCLSATTTLLKKCIKDEDYVPKPSLC